MNTSKKRKVSFILICGFIAASLTACGTSQTQESADRSAEPAAAEKQETQGAKEAWQEEWDKTLELAKKEGEVVIIGQPSAEREKQMQEFEKLYGIKAKYTGMRPSEAVPKLLSEFKQDRYLTDVLLEGGQQGVMDMPDYLGDVRDYIIMPDIREDKTWHYGFENGFKIAGNVGHFTFGIIPEPSFLVNNDMIPEGEIKSFKDLLDPKWKEKIIINDFTRPAQGRTTMTGVYLTEGEEYVTRLMENKPLLADDLRQIAEWFATGKYPIGIGVSASQLDSFVKAGVVKKYTIIEPEISTVANPRVLAVFKKVPHPNATKVFVNYFLSKQGQDDFIKFIPEGGSVTISGRTDVKVPAGLRQWDKIDIKSSILDETGLKASEWIGELGKQTRAK